MRKEIENNKSAWEYRVYEWRVKQQGTPEYVAKEIMKSPNAFLRYHSEMFREIRNKKIANICGSDGRRAVALAALGADVTIFDISEPQKEYALQLASAAKVSIQYEIGDFYKVTVKDYFDYSYCEGGILHYFHDLNSFFEKVYQILLNKGRFILSDYHPLQKAISADEPVRNIELTEGDYFDTRIHNGHLPYAKFFATEEQESFPKCSLRFYTLSEIINSALGAGFVIKGFWEHPKHNNPKIPGEFTLILDKYD